MRHRFAVVEVSHASGRDGMGHRTSATWHIEDLRTGELIEGPFDSQLAAERWLAHLDMSKRKEKKA